MSKQLELLGTGLAGKLMMFAVLMLVAGVVPAAAPNTDPNRLWQDVSEAEITRRSARWIEPQQYRALSLNYAGLQAHLARAPMEGSVGVTDSPLKLSLPMPDGSYAEFAIVESPIMEAALGAKYPSIRTYAGQGLADATATLRLDFTPQGFHAQVLSARGDYYIDPYQAHDNEHYVSYLRRDMGEAGKHYRCGVEGHDHGSEIVGRDSVVPNNPTGASLRTYRIAVAATPTFTNSFGSSVADGLGGVTTLVNRVSGVYEREFAVRLIVVANNDLIIYTTANPGPLPDPPNSPSAQIQSTIDNAIGFANYDIGHAVGGTGGGGAITPLGNVCGTQKAQGFTAFDPPRGDIFDIDFVAHELGHQMGGSHTWNGCSNQSAGQWTPTSAMEPGSGTTIMAYAGICADNLMPNSDSYFHARSFTQIFQNITSGGSGNGNTVCGAVTATGNAPPNITAPANMTIPEQTPFELTATGNDPDAGDVVTYNWEQVDTGSRGAPSTNGDNGTAPLFRTFYATSSPTRIFPSIQYILDNANVPPAAIPLPPAGGTFFPAEILPNPASGTRVMNFRVTARDNRALGGGLRHSPNVQVTAAATAGPFAVGNITGPLTGGSTQAITWTVASTDLAPINTTLVNILISHDGGYTFSTLLANTANDGSETVTIPNVDSARTRVRVEAANGTGIAAGNTYFDITNSNFAITAGGSAVTVTALTAAANLILTQQGSPAPSVRNIATISGGASPYTATADTYPAYPEITIQSLSVSGTSVLATAAASCQVAAPNAPSFRIYPAVLKITDAANRTASAVFPINVSNNDIPTIGTFTNQIVTRGSTVNVSPAAAPSDANGNFVGVSVSPTTLPGGGTVTVNTVSGQVTVTTTGSTVLGTYTIRVFASDTCGALGGEQFTVAVTTVDPVLNFNGAAVLSGNNLIEPNECNTLDVTLGNTGGGTANTISSILSTSTPGVSITQNGSVYPNIPSSGTGVNDTEFQISTLASVACGSTIALTQTVTYAGVGSPSTFNFNLPVGQPAGTNYQFVSSSGAAAVPGTTILAGSQADDAVVALSVPAGFAFSAYGTPVTQLRADTNGTLQFNTATGDSEWDNTALPIGVYAAPTLFAHWDDFDMRTANVTGGGIFVSESGVAPNRVLNVEWRAAQWRATNPSPALPAPTIVFTVRLYETINRIEIVYTTLTGNIAGGANGGSATVGIQKMGTGTDFTQFSFNTASLAAGQMLTLGFPTGVCNVGPGDCNTAANFLFSSGFE